MDSSSGKSGNTRKQPLLTKEHESRRFCEVAGGTTADCAAVACCPCALVNLAFLAFVKLPAGLCKKAWSKSKRKRSKKMNKKKNSTKQQEGMESEVEENSVASSLEELITPRHSVVVHANANANANSLVMQQTTFITTQKVWEEVVGKSYVGFWRNVSFRE